jgi:Glycosyl hydrolase family 99
MAVKTSSYLLIGIAIIGAFLLGNYLHPLEPAHQAKAAGTTAQGTPSVQPLRGIFYYPWFPETWGNAEITPFTHYHPTLGSYSSSDPAVLTQQINAMQYAGMQVGIFEWNGQGTTLDQRIPQLLHAATGTGFHWAAYYDQEGLSVGFGPNPTPDQIASDLTYINQNYASDPSYERINGKPVVFVYGDGQDDCSMVDRWNQANQNGQDYIVLKVFGGYAQCPNQPDGWHQYAPGEREDNQQNYSFSISPGFWKADETTPRLARDPNAFAQAVRDMVASNAPFQLVTTFNEWGEGTAVEDAQEWNSPSGYGIYLDTLHTILGANPCGPTPAPSATATVS